MPAETQRQANSARMAYAFKHDKLDVSKANDSIKQMAKMPDEELKKLMTLKEGEENSLSELGRKWSFLNQELNYNMHGELADFLGPYYKRAAADFNGLNNQYQIEESKDLRFLDEDTDFVSELEKIIKKYHITIPEQPLEETEKKDERELLMDKKSSRAYEEIYDVIKNYFTDDRTHLSLKGNVIHFEKRNPEIGEWEPAVQELKAKKQWKMDGQIQNWASPKSADPFRLDIIHMTADASGVKGDILILLNNYLEEDMGCTGDIAVSEGPIRI
jgi:hypothetical protein